MFDVTSFCRSDLESFMDDLGVRPAEWWPQIPDLFEPELSHPSQVQVRLDAGFIALVMRSHYGSLRTRSYRVLGDSSLDFSVASGCERVSRRYPESAWLLKIALCGTQPHVKLYLDRRVDLDELSIIVADLGLPERAVMRTAEMLLDATQTDALRWISIAPGRPVRMELYTSTGERPGGTISALEALCDRVQLDAEPEFELLHDIHRRLSSAGRQRFCVGIDGQGVRDGLKLGYDDVRGADVTALVDALAPAPAMARRRLKLGHLAFAEEALDHISVRLRPGLPPHLTAYYNRSWAAVA